MTKVFNSYISCKIKDIRLIMQVNIYNYSYSCFF